MAISSLAPGSSMVESAVLDIFVVWHPDDVIGSAVFAHLWGHFHSPSFSGLVGSAVEVYQRSKPWKDGEGAPRPLPLEPGGQRIGGDPAAVSPARYVVIIPVISADLVREASVGSEWLEYIKNIASLGSRENVTVLPVANGDRSWPDSALGRTLNHLQYLPAVQLDGLDTLGREVAQAAVQFIRRAQGCESRLSVFVSHTKRFSDEEEGGRNPKLYDVVRDRLQGTHLSSFFDAHDLQPGEKWEEKLRSAAGHCALLMVRTDKYSSREWTQEEVALAKAHEMPVVALYAPTSGDERGSFLMDHVPAFFCDVNSPHSGVERALNRLVDESLKIALWSTQCLDFRGHNFDWLPAQSPEPSTLIPWLNEKRKEHARDGHLWIMHPDPPLGKSEDKLLKDMCRAAGFGASVDIMTPRTFVSRGGQSSPSSDPMVIPRDALNGHRLALSVSDSADLERLGLSGRHCSLVVAEVARAVFLAGGSVIYGGDLRAGGFTEVILEEAQKFGGDRCVFTVILAQSVHQRIDLNVLRDRSDALAPFGKIVCLSQDGSILELSESRSGPGSLDPSASLSSMRMHVTDASTARLVVGGSLSRYSGRMPGVIEESISTLESKKPLLIAGGYGGAAAALGRALIPENFESWMPHGFPGGADETDVSKALERLRSEHASITFSSSDVRDMVGVLAVTHRPAEIARAVVQILSLLPPQ